MKHLQQSRTRKNSQTAMKRCHETRRRDKECNKVNPQKSKRLNKQENMAASQYTESDWPNLVQDSRLPPSLRINFAHFRALPRTRIEAAFPSNADLSFMGAILLLWDSVQGLCYLALNSW